MGSSRARPCGVPNRDRHFELRPGVRSQAIVGGAAARAIDVARRPEEPTPSPASSKSALLRSGFTWMEIRGHDTYP
jgi:hypothetical protein